MTTNQTLLAAGIFLALTSSSASAGTITTFTSTCGSVPSPVASPGSDAFPVNLPFAPPCVIGLAFTTGPATTYNFAVTVTNNTGQVMTDLELSLISSVGDTFIGSADSSVLPFDAGTSTNSYLVFMGPPNLPVGANDTVYFSVLMAGYQGFPNSDSLIIVPTFTPDGSAPEPASVGFIGLGLTAVGALRFRPWTSFYK